MSYSASFGSGSASGSFSASASGSASVSGSASASAPVSASFPASASSAFSASFGSRVSNRTSRLSRFTASPSASAAPQSPKNQASQIEQAIVNAAKPIDINETETITANGVTGIWANKQETAGLDLSKYQLYNDPNPEVIKKHLDKLVQKQLVQIRYLRPPPVNAGNIVVRQQPDIPATPAPPLVIRVQGKPDPCACKPNPCNPCGGCQQPAGCGPIVIREAPPKTPCSQPEKVITIPGKKLPPPPRRVIIEKLPDAAKKPQNIILEKWLPYQEGARKVVFEPAAPAPKAENPRNLIIEWTASEVELEKEFVNLGVVDADPREYRKKYNFNKTLKDLPPLAAEANSQSASPRPATTSAPKLEGDLHALSLIDLDKEGLGQYRHLVQ